MHARQPLVPFKFRVAHAHQDRHTNPLSSCQQKEHKKNHHVCMPSVHSSSFEKGLSIVLRLQCDVQGTSVVKQNKNTSLCTTGFVH